MKKIFLILFFIIMIGGCSNHNYLKEINYNEFNSMMRNEESFILYVGQTSCSACSNYTPIFTQVLKNHDVTAYYIDLNNLNDNYTAFIKTINVHSTPSIVFIKDGKETSTLHRINGSVSYEKTVDKLKNQGYIKE